MKLRTRRLLMSLLIGMSIFLVLPLVISSFIYEQQFGSRQETPAYLKYEVEEFEQLKQIPVFFPSNHNQTLSGSIYINSEVLQPKGVIIVSPDLGAGHHTYLPEIDYMAQEGYIIFSYDGTGTDASEGESIVGVPQAIIDLDYAIDYIKDKKQFDGFPLMLYGHSAGGYAAISVLTQHQDITAIVERSGFYDSTDLIKTFGAQLMGPVAHLLTPYIKVYEWLKFGEYAKINGLDALNQTKTHVLFMHSQDDDVVSYNQNFVKFVDLFESRAPFKFISYQDRGHDVVINSTLLKTVRKQFEEDYSSLVEMPQEIRRMYNEVLYDLDYRLDISVMKEIIGFFDQWIIKEYE